MLRKNKSATALARTAFLSFGRQAWTLHSTHLPTVTSFPIEQTFLRGPENLRQLRGGPPPDPPEIGPRPGEPASGRTGPACEPLRLEPGSELWLSNTAIGRAGDPRQTGGRGAGESVLGLIGACWALRRLKMALRWLQEAPRRAKMRQDAPKRAPRRPKTPPRRPKMPPRRPKMLENGAKMESSWHQNRIQNRF